jgi:aromatic ring hydroxylase
MAGAASMMLKANWLENVQPLREKVVEMIALSEGIHAVAVGGPRWAMSSGGVATK